MNVVLYHLFPDLLNLYGDYGNIITLKHHLESLGIKVTYKRIVDIKDFDKDECHFILIGGGSDREQTIATKRLEFVKDEIKALIENDLPLLAVCGGYQFLGNTYKCLDGTILDGLKLFDMETVATEKRMVGNIVVNTDFGQVVGFENHSGETFHDYDVLGEVTVGYGSNLARNGEGLIYKSLIGTYMHGPILPKNSGLIKWYIKAICNYVNLDVDINKLDFELEDLARDRMLEKLI